MAMRRAASIFWPWLASVTAVGLLFFWYRYLEVLSSRASVPVAEPLINEMTGALGAGILFWGVRALVARRPLAGAGWARRLPPYLLGLLVYAVLHTSFMWGSRTLLYRLAGLPAFDYGEMPLRYLMELPVQAIAFGVMVAALHVVAAFRRGREREVRAAQLAESLARAELRSLRLQLQPHFLFNALNTVSSTMYRDPAAADELIDRLATLLRASLKTARTDEVPLAEELESLQAYLALLEARFGERLRVRLEVAPGLADALVPSMILQPLVENAIRHGRLEREGTGAIEVRARRADGRLLLEVEDDGPGVPPGADPLAGGVGLASTAERLQLLYGAEHEFAAGNGPRSGFLVRASLPLRRAARKQERAMA